MKKVLVSISIIFIMFSFMTVFAVEEKNILETETTGQILQIKEETQATINEYTEKYGSKEYGMTAFILNTLRLYSIPFCFIGIAIGAIFQYIVGTRRLDMKQKGFGLIITFITLLVICQVLPLIFAIVVRGWRG